MPRKSHVVVLDTDPAALADDARRLHNELGHGLGSGVLTGECVPPLDIFETDDAVEIVLDVPGVDPNAIRIVARANALLVAGVKTVRRTRGEASFHLVERGYGRFSRTVALTHACDPRRASATLSHGELRVRLPRVDERRGALIRIPISTDAAGA